MTTTEHGFHLKSEFRKTVWPPNMVSVLFLDSRKYCVHWTFLYVKMCLYCGQIKCKSCCYFQCQTVFSIYVYSVQCTGFSVQCTVYSVKCTVYSVQYTAYSIQCTVYSVQYILVECGHSIRPPCLLAWDWLFTGEAASGWFTQDLIEKTTSGWLRRKNLSFSYRGFSFFLLA